MPHAEPFRASAYLAPRHWPTWAGLGLLRLAALLPYRMQMALGAGLGTLLYGLMPRRRRIVNTNIGLCFADWSEPERRRLARRNFRSTGKTLFECALAWWGSDQRVGSLLGRVEGLEHIHAALERGRGVILLSGHFSAFEIGGRLFAQQQPAQFMYRVQRKNPLYDAYILHIRRGLYEAGVAHNDARGMVRGLRANRVCWYLPDQDMGRRYSVFAPFFGVPAATLVAPMRFARMTGAAVVPYYPRRRADGTGYDLHILPALEDFPSGDDEADAARINRFLEAAIREAPEQYLWLHRRFKTLPEGGKRRY